MLSLQSSKTLTSTSGKRENCKIAVTNVTLLVELETTSAAGRVFGDFNVFYCFSAVPGSQDQPTYLTLNNSHRTRNIHWTSTGSSGTLADIYTPGFRHNASEVCGFDGGQDIRILVLVTSAPKSEDRRQAIRQTWGHFALRRDVAIAFVLGQTRNVSTQKNIDSEADIYGDIIQGLNVDSYHNLTLKTLSSLIWVSDNCEEADFILKTDDDMAINMPKLFAYLNSLGESTSNSIYGRVAAKWKVHREQKSKYYVSPAEYSPMRFPKFCTGPAYVLTKDVVPKLLSTALGMKFMRLEDVFFTGIVADAAEVQRIAVKQFHNTRPKHLATCTMVNSIAIHGLTTKEQYDVWKRVMDGAAKCKSVFKQ